MRVESVDQRLHVRDFRLRAGVLLEDGIVAVEVQPELILHVDDERVDLGRVGDADELPHLAGALGREAVDVETSNRRIRVGSQPLDLGGEVSGRYRRCLSSGLRSTYRRRIYGIRRDLGFSS